MSGLSKRYGRLVALEDVSLSVHPGEVLGLIGPSGAGKTTLFESVLRAPVAGRIGLWSKTDSTSYFKDYVVSIK